MKHISTSALAKERDLETKELFKQLTQNGWIFRNGDNWVLTKEGRIAGGDMHYNPQYGEYIVWPSNLDLSQTIKKTDTLSSTEIGKQFDMSAQKINLLLAELGWIEKSEVGGWDLTKYGEKNGGIKMEASNGAPYVIWRKELLDNKNFQRSISTAKGENLELNEEHQTGELDDYRLKYPANYRTQDGHRVRSKSEALIDDYLYREGIAHAYERKLPIDEDVISDFYILKGNVYIEYWGMENDERYNNRKKQKLEIYAREGFNLIELTEADIQNIDDALPKKLRKFGIKVGMNN
ncbi:MAG: glycerol kinase [Cyclobacteriaceae bacterium]